ncbi:prolyl oligopeptidase family serine peptidase [uncultured Pseudoteredinibacter sp.]|uniref:S9 family peptidase n=1 Tax=uncultured Pseudoteredinibacter sp. TaxID=1641701 RepID=UPI00260CCA57|nr:prolyl oligopeptidase family serine peptidase [uncultured Pseudoteredinibacter sp.]
MKPYTFILLCLIPLLSFADKEIEYFIADSDYHSAKISPDGKTLAVKLKQKGVNRIAFLDAKTLKPTGGLAAQPGNDFYSYSWASNDRLVFEFAYKTSFRDRPVPTGQIVASDKNGKRQRIVYGFGSSKSRIGSLINSGASKERKASATILSYLPEDKDHILIAEHPWSKIGTLYYNLKDKPVFISKINIYTGKKRQQEVISLPGARPIASANGKIEFLTHTNENDQSKVYRRAPDNPKSWLPLDIEGLGNRNKLVGINQSGTEVYLSSKLSNGDKSSFYKLNTQNYEIERLFPGVNHPLSDWILDPKTSQPAVAITEPDKFQYHYYGSNDTVRFHKMLAKAFKGKRVKFLNHSENGEKIVVLVDSDTTPAQFYLFDTNSKQANLLFARQSWINSDLLQKVEALSFNARDGLKIHAYFTPSKLGPNSPLVVIPHGGPHRVRDYWKFNAKVQLLAFKGYNVLQVNFRGSGGYGDKFERAGYKEWGGKMVEDIIDGTKFVQSSTRLTTNKACIFGASYGGLAALMATAKERNLFQCAIGYVGVYDLEKMSEESIVRHIRYGKSYLNTAIGTEPKLLQKNSPIHYADKISAKVLLIGAKKDHIVPFEQSEAMRTALTKVGNDPKWLRFSKAGHGVYDEKDQFELYAEIVKFLDQHTK